MVFDFAVWCFLHSLLRVIRGSLLLCYVCE